MKKLFGVLLAVVVGVGIATTNAHATINDFTFTSFKADYYLGIDTDKRSTLKTVETLTAEFPETSKNRGIERAIPKDYDGHTTSLKLISVKDTQGADLPYSTYSDKGNLVVRIGDEDRYVKGLQTYVLTYTQRDVTKQFNGVDEFYWDTNGTDWQQPFREVDARIHIEDSLRSAMNSDVSCYVGTVGSTKNCETTATSTSVNANVIDLRAGENVTLAIGFQSGTFAEYRLSLGELLLRLWLVSLIVTSLVAVGIIIWISVRYSRKNNRDAELGTIIPEYVPPKNASIFVSEQIAKQAKAGFTAAIIDLSVRHYLKLYQTREKALLKAAQYELEIAKNISTLSMEEQAFVKTLFGAENTNVGSRFEMKKLANDYKLAAVLRKNTKEVEALIKGEYAFRSRQAKEASWFTRMGWIVCGVGILTLSPPLLVAAIIAWSCGSQLAPLSDKGLALRRYLEGLKLYIGVAETDRLKMLQSPEGAEKTGIISTDDSKRLVKLYERVLPYAVLFGQEKEWSKQLGVYYEKSGAQPEWYSGHSAFNAALFASAISDFNTTTNSYSAATSSSSSGSSGGGSSGGGGGGGGGGGW